jgi:Fe2+ or Zn2+ uptake regulation protein
MFTLRMLPSHESTKRRLPKNYERILQLVCAQAPGQHRTANELYAAAHKRYPSMGVSTVYRGLARLRDLGLVSEIVVPGSDSALYEQAGKAHAHFRCTVCGAIEDVDYTIAPRVLRQLSSDLHHAVDGVTLAFHGACSGCSESVVSRGSAADRSAQA